MPPTPSESRTSAASGDPRTPRAAARRRTAWIAGATAALAIAGVGLTLPASAQRQATATTPPDAAMVTALSRDLGMTTDQARAQLAAQDRAQVTAQRVRNTLGDRHAGTWFDATTGRLAVAVTNAADAATARSTGADAHLVARSAAQLDRISDTIARLATNRPSAGINSWGTDPTSNTIVVRVNTARADTASRRFAAAARALDGVRVIEEDTVVKQQGGAIRPGDAWYNGGGRCSVAFPAVSANGTKNFVTAGHCTTNIGGTAQGPDRTNIGIMRASTNARAGDFGRVEVTYATWTLSSSVNTYSSGLTVHVTGSGDAPVNTAICRSGSTTGWRCGRVTAVNQTVNYGSVTIEGLSYSNACSAAGDSGGQYVANTTAVGIHSGGTQDCNVSSPRTIFQPVQEALTAYGLQVYTGNITPSPTSTATVSPTPTPTDTPSPTPTTTTPPGTCTGYQNNFSGSLSSGASAYQPNNSYFQTTVSGSHRACLDGPSGTDYDLYLQRWNGSAWSNVASGSTSAADEMLSYSGSAGYYRYRVHAYSGSGTYRLGYNRP